MPAIGLPSHHESVLQGSFPLWAARGETIARISGDERVAIAGCLRQALSHYYVHLPQKVATMAIDPLRELELLAGDASWIGPDLQFWRRLLDIFVKLRDRHTTVRAPAPWNSMVAFLPFALESCWEDGRRLLIMSKMADDLGEPHFRPGIEVTHWNGTPIRSYVETLSWRTSGSNPYARVALALKMLTVRPLAFVEPPDEDWVTFTYRCPDGQVRHASIPWRVYVPPQPDIGASGLRAAGLSAIDVGLDEATHIVNDGWRRLFSDGDAAGRAERHLAAGTGGEEVALPASVAPYCRASCIATPRGAYGYLRIFSFGAPDPRPFAEGMAELVGRLPAGGLLIDLRANPGGTIPAGEALLQVLSPRPVIPASVGFRGTLQTRRMAGAIDFLEPWRRSLDMIDETGQAYSQTYSLTSMNDYMDLAGAYRGPLAIIIDALSYSTTDFFAAGFADNALGPVIGVDPTTGAGGANVWTLAMISQFARQAGMQDLAPLPWGMDANLAVRRALRIGLNVGLPLEGIGATTGNLHFLTRRDVLAGNVDLIDYALGVLAAAGSGPGGR